MIKTSKGYRIDHTDYAVAFLKFAGDMPKIADYLGIKEEEAHRLWSLPHVWDLIMVEMAQREKKWEQIAVMCKGTLMRAMVEPDVTMKDRLTAAKVGLEAILKGNLMNLKDAVEAEDEAFDTAVNKVLEENDGEVVN